MSVAYPNPSLGADAFNTQLSPDEQAAYQQFLAESAANGRDLSRDSQDYDLQGWFKSNMGASAPSGHFTDQFKKPNHPTFSDQSQYSGSSLNGMPLTGGQWSEAGGRDVFTPSADMLRNTHSLTGLMEYMKQVEPNAVLNMDKRGSQKALIQALRRSGQIK